MWQEMSLEERVLWLKNGSPDPFLEYVRGGGDPNVKRSDGRPIYMCAVVRENLEVAKELFSRGLRCDPEVSFFDTWDTYMSDDVFDWAIAAGLNSVRTPESDHRIIYKNTRRPDRVKKLIESGSNKEALGGYTLKVTPLYAAARGGFIKTGLVLIEAGCDVNFSEGSHGHSPLTLAARLDNSELFFALLAAGADLDRFAELAFKTALPTGSQDVLKFLLSKYPRLAYTRTDDYYVTIIFWLASRDDCNDLICIILRDYWVDLDIVNCKGYTALEIALINGNFEGFKYLFEVWKIRNICVDLSRLSELCNEVRKAIRAEFLSYITQLQMEEMSL